MCAKKQKDILRGKESFENRTIYQLMMNTANLIMLILDVNANIKHINKKGCLILGYKEEELIGKNWFSLCISEKDTPDQPCTDFKKILAGKADLISNNENWVIIRSGAKKLVKWKNSLIKNEEGEITGVLCMGEDVTTQRRLIKELQGSEEKYRHLVDQSSAGIFQINTKGEFIFVNSAMQKILEYSNRQEILDHTITEHFEDHRQSRRFINSIRKNSNIRNLEEEFITRKKNRRSVILNATLHDQAITGMMMDVTDRKKAEEALRASEDQFKRIFSSIQEGYFLLELDGKIKNVNPATARILRYENTGELINLPFGEMILEYPEDFLILRDNLIRQQELINHELTFRRRNGEHLIADCSIHLLQNDQNEVYAIEGTFRDATERIGVAEALRSSLQLNKSMQDFSINDMIEHGLEEAVRLTASHIGFFHFVNEKEGTITLQSWSKETLRHCDVPDRSGHYPISSAGIWVDCIKERKPIIHNDYKSALNKKGLPEGHFPLIRQLTVPIIDNEEIVAVIGVGNKSTEYTEFDIKQLSFYAENVLSIIRRKQGENDLQIARDDAVKANKAKSVFLANMSHEIRTPMNSVIGFADLLDSQISDPVQHGYVESIKSSSRTLLRIINDILDLSKIEAGRMDLQPEPTDLRALYHELENVFLIQAHQKNIGFRIEISKNIPPLIIIDEIRLRQILLNLIGNAIKFTEEGYVSLSCNYLKQGKLEIIVEDTGIGIPADAREQIFDSFRQQDEQDRRKYGGTGLGLSITKRLVELMNGTISLKSELNRGSMFTVRFTNITPVLKGKIKKTAHPEQYIFEPALLLLVDDLPSNRSLVRGFIKDTKLEVIEAADGQEAIQMAMQYRPDLILMDIRMPVMDGYESAAFIKKNKSLSDIPVIALTASVSIDKNDLARNTIFDGIIFKPITSAELQGELAKYLKIKKSVPVRKSLSRKKIEVKNPAQVKNLIQELESVFVSRWENVMNASNINEFEKFSIDLEQLAGKYDNEYISDYASKLSQYTRSFDIENILAELKDFQHLIKNLKSVLAQENRRK
jgi:PAS domain S-box-containing protein